MKVLHLLNTGRFSGAENVVCQIIELFKDDENIEMVYCSRDGQIREALCERKISFIPVEKLNVKELKKIINKVSPDIIHAHDMRAGFLAALSCKKTPLISHIHNNSFESRRLSIKSILFLLAAKKAKHIFWVSNSSFSGYIFHKFFAKKSSVLYNTINIKSLQEKKNADQCKYDYDVVFIGSLIFPKNPQRLINVFRKVVDISPSIKIGIVGTGTLEEEVKTMCAELNLEKNVTFLGYRNNPLKVLSDAKVMVMTSRWEGTPMCALEAMALGVPIVSTPTDGLKDLIEDGKNGYLSDDDDVLAKKIANIVLDGELRKRLSVSIKEKASIINDIDAYKNFLLEKYNME